ncbi:SDR family NAD(P)-dependent oxidoreductase [Tistrella mobilis]|uniref:3-hydroxyacyl-CoA dehydrogenase type-2 n=1 Tax=Tistrella mobilis (strain KA081020-065) TaxID=1110502 RepID=I3TQG3_TISMK|nr:SDR family NAD(P)-dependent oxidoreductase [Tistrella mobilis]AFK55001.1 3-hydroxyacyl-CoA dehydrogenase type-2 [Tistrella mobilis KA081020-065]
MQINGVAAVVTGGASGLGAGTARALAAAGAKVTVVDLNEEAIEELAREIGGLAIKLDVTNPAAAEAAFETAAAAHGPVRILVNCAGIAPAFKVLGKEGPASLDAFAKVVNVNLIGTFNMIRLAAAQMAKADPVTQDGERGVIINTASIAAFEGQVGQSAYSASKGGVVGLLLPVARELAQHGIRMCTIAPGIFGTPMLFGLPQQVQDSLGASVPFPSRLGRPEEYAALARHIVENSMLNGEVIRLDGAIRMSAR